VLFDTARLQRVTIYIWERLVVCR